jgi:hypothetical protein
VTDASLRHRIGLVLDTLGPPQATVNVVYEVAAEMSSPSPGCTATAP